MDNPVTVQDVINRWRPLSDAEIVIAETRLGDAWDEIQLRVSRLVERLEDETLPVGLVKRVVADSVIRLMQNPDGKTRERIDDYEYTRADSVQGLGFTDGELDLLAPTDETTGAFTIRPHYEVCE